MSALALRAILNRTAAIQRSFQSSGRLLATESGGVYSTANMGERPVQTTIESKLQEALKPSHLEVINESYMHNVPRGSETHFKVVVVSKTFQGLPLLKRHRLVTDTLKTELEGGVHALSIQARTLEQWEASGGSVSPSPPCLGGYNK